MNEDIINEKSIEVLNKLRSEGLQITEIIEVLKKALSIHGVVKSFDCEHTGDEILHQGNGFIYKTCADCGEDI